MDVKVSVIMPSLNVGKYIEEAVRSVMCQTLREIEIICIDAGSDDGTWEVLTELAKTDGRMILRHSDRKSYGYQVNMGMDMARGKYIAVLETDDYVSPEMYGNLFYAAEQQGCDYVKGDCLAYWTQNNGERFFFRKRNFSQDNLYEKVITPRNYISIAADDWYLWTGIYKKEFLERNNIRLSETQGAAFQDIGFIHQTVVSAKRALYLRDANYQYCMDREGASSNSGKALAYSYQEFFRLLQVLSAGKEPEPAGNAEVFLYCRMAKSFVCSYEEVWKQSAGMDNAKKHKYYKWFREKLGDAVNRGVISSENIHPAIWDKVEALLESEECYMEKNRRWEENIRKNLGEPGEVPVVVFGCGYCGYQAYQWLGRKGYHILAFMDNNEALWGKRIDGYLIEPPEKVTVWKNREKYLIANELYYNEIRNQLLDMGVRDEKICLYI